MKLRRRLRTIVERVERLPLPRTSPRRLLEPTDLLAAFAKAWSKRDADAIADLFVEDADFVNVVGLWWRSRRAIRRAHAYGFEHAFGRSKLTIERVRERRITDDVALVVGEWRLRGQVGPDGTETGPRRGVISAVAVRLADGSWIGVSCQNTDTATAADTNVSVDGRLGPVSYIEPPSPEVLAALEHDRQHGPTDF
jgi:uncharacterized protein (TIGR02246 family)